MRPGTPPLPLGAHLSGSRASFCVWAPHARSVELVLLDARPRTLPMTAVSGYFTALVDDIADGQRYAFRLDGGDRTPDPASRYQPEGVHGPSALVSTDYPWKTGNWTGLPLEDYVLYELHVGTFTPEGTFEAAARRIPALRDLGVTAVELMPVAQFPGHRNWGYDGVLPFAAQNSYGGPHGLKHFVDHCHAEGIAVCLDVVYNHLGPEGNHLARFGPYFTGRYHTPWGHAVNFDGPDSDDVRAFFLASALQWIDEFRIDALRLDAVHAMLDQTAQPFLREIADSVHARARSLGRTAVVIAESDLNDPRMIRPSSADGLGMDAQWLDDFHHALHSLVTGERTGYYVDFGRCEELTTSYDEGFVYAGQYSTYRRRRHGAPTGSAAPRQFVAYAQNHDQIGNRMLGDRLSSSLSFEQLKLCAAAVLLGPFTPLLFMGEEYGEVAPFPYFVSHTDAALVEAVRRGRADEFAAFAWAGDPPDPQARSTFESAILNWGLREQGEHACLLAFHRELIRTRRAMSCLRPRSFDDIRARCDPASDLVHIAYADHDGEARLLLHFGRAPIRAPVPDGRAWCIRFDTSAEQWRGPGRAEPNLLRAGSDVELAPHSALLLVPTRG
jgi:maltooligosyltrehalose trehalohydrolase